MLRSIRLFLCAAVSMLAVTGCWHSSGGSGGPVVSSGLASPGPTSASSPANTPQPASPPASTPTKAPADPVAEKVASMSLTQKLGQMVLVGVDGYEADEHARKLIQTYQVGGIIFYKNNIKNTSQFVGMANALKQANHNNPIPLWLSVDEEGGRVTRLPDELLKTPTNEAIGKIGKPQFSYEIGGLLGKELQAYGLNMDFAPVLDINSNPKNPVIGDRSFGANASVVGSLGVQTMKGIQAQHVIPVVKHFPGHGDTSVDSHVGLPVVQNDLNRLRKLELVPFAAAFKEQADAVMVAHILLPRIDDKYPASMSRKIITDLLRDEMGFKGVVMTDDMTMGAIVKNYSIGEAAVQSVLAGADVIMVGHEYENAIAVIRALQSAVEQKRIPMSAIDASAARIVRLKERYEIKDEQVQAPRVSELNDAVKKLLQSYK